MNNNVIISCPVTGSGDTAKKHPNLPITPKQIAEAAIEAAKAGAAIAHIHVRESNGAPSRKLDYYKEVADRVRSSDTDVVINFTTGMGGDFEVGEGKDPLNPVGKIQIWYMHWIDLSMLKSYCLKCAPLIADL